MEFYLVSTSHLEDRLWFRDEDDYKVGMNYVAVTAYTTGIEVPTFILMSNHVHFVLQCTHPGAEQFINQFKHRYSIYIRNKYGIPEMLRGIQVDIRRVGLEEESLERAIAYVIMNSVAANICLHASQYPWGTGNLLFNQQPTKGRTLKNYSARALSRLLHSWIELPETYRMSDEGYILPESYIPASFVESLYRTPKRLNWFLLNSSKAKARLSHAESPSPAFRDQSVADGIQDLCRSLFRKGSFKELAPEQKAELVQQIKMRYSIEPAQIARVAGITYDEAAKLLDSFYAGIPVSVTPQKCQ